MLLFLNVNSNFFFKLRAVSSLLKIRVFFVIKLDFPPLDNIKKISPLIKSSYRWSKCCQDFLIIFGLFLSRNLTRWTALQNEFKYYNWKSGFFFFFWRGQNSHGLLISERIGSWNYSLRRRLWVGKEERTATFSKIRPLSTSVHACSAVSFTPTPIHFVLLYFIFYFFPHAILFFTLPFTVKSIVIFCPLPTQQCSLHLRGSNLRMTWLYWLINCRSIVTSQSAVCSRFWKDLYSSQVVSLLISNPSRS